jgi:hypothetical protein
MSDNEQINRYGVPMLYSLDSIEALLEKGMREEAEYFPHYDIH